MGPLSRLRLLNVARAVECELLEKKDGLVRPNGGRYGFGSGSQYSSNSYYPLGQSHVGRGHMTGCM